VCIICPTHGEFFITPKNHMHEQGCAKCSNRVSLAEIHWLNSLSLPFLERQKSIKVDGKKFIVDGFDPTTNTVYEFHGDFWHGNPKIYDPNDVNWVVNKSFGQLYRRTLKKEEFLRRHFTVVVMWHSEYLAKGYV
jgi:hypothetical protein